MADVMQPPKGGEPDTPEQKKPVPLVNDGLSPSDVDFIPPLVHSLVTLLRLRGKSVSTAFLMAGLAGTGRVSPGACLHAAKRAGLEGKIVYRKSLQDISTLVLPCILLLSRDRSCVLTSLDDGKAGVIFPETGEGVQPVPLQMLADEYTGYAIFATREARLDQRADRIQVQTILPAGTASEQEILQIAAACETASTHPIGISIVSAAKDQKLVIEKPAEIEEISGKGIHARLSQGEVLCGNRKLLTEFNVVKK